MNSKTKTDPAVSSKEWLGCLGAPLYSAIGGANAAMGFQALHRGDTLEGIMGLFGAFCGIWTGYMICRYAP